METQLQIIPLKDCDTEDPKLRTAIDRLLHGPISVIGYHPIYIIANSEQYFLLEADDMIVGFCSIYNEDNKVVLNEFEIFQEFRQYGYGKKFAKHIFATINPNEFYEMMSSAFLFWWKVLGGIYFVQHIASVIDAQSVKSKDEKKEIYETWMIKYKHKEQLNTAMAFNLIARTLIENPLTPFEEIKVSVEDSAWFRSILVGKRPDTPRPMDNFTIGLHKN
jgi:predicted acetyltransferase